MATSSGPSFEDEDEGAIFADINITPLTDVFVVLLVIFMVVSTSITAQEKEQAAKAATAAAATRAGGPGGKSLSSERVFEVQTPQGAGESLVVPKDIVISVTADGTLFVDDIEVPLADLGDHLRARQGASETRVVIRGDKSVDYQKVMEAISTARAAGFKDVALSSRVK